MFLCIINNNNWLWLTFDCQQHAFADIWADTIAGLAQIVAAILLQNMSDKKRTIGHDLDAACKRNWMVLLWVSNTWKTKMYQMLQSWKKVK